MSSEEPLHELITERVILTDDVELDGIGKLHISITPLVGGQLFRIDLHRSGRICHTEWDVKADALEDTIRGFRKRVWWQGHLAKPEEKEHKETLSRRLRELLQAEPPTCYVCHEVADWHTPCRHKICSKCELKSIECGTFTCGMCRRRYIDDTDGWVEDDGN